MSEDNKSFLRDRLRFTIVVSLIIALMILMAVQWIFPRGSVIDDPAVQAIEQMSKTFTELKDQNQKIIDMNIDANRKLSALLDTRRTQRDEAYQALLEKYGALEKENR